MFLLLVAANPLLPPSVATKVAPKVNFVFHVNLSAALESGPPIQCSASVLLQQLLQIGNNFIAKLVGVFGRFRLGDDSQNWLSA